MPSHRLPSLLSRHSDAKGPSPQGSRLRPTPSGPDQTGNLPRLQDLLQYLHRGGSGVEHQTPSSLLQLLPSSPPHEALTGQASGPSRPPFRP